MARIKINLKAKKVAIEQMRPMTEMDDYVYKPRINEKSNELAKGRYSIKQRTKSMSSHHDLLITCNNKPMPQVYVNNIL